MTFFLLIVLSFISSNLFAQEIHFFGSLDYAKTTIKKDIDYNNVSHRFGTSNLTTAGINVSGNIDSNSRVLVQVLHSPIPNKVVIDLVQIQRNFVNDFTVRLGQQRLPVFLKSEVIQVKALYPWLNAPYEVYSQLPMRSFTGGSLEKGFGNFSAQAYVGETNDSLYQGEAETKINGKELLGLRLNYEKDDFVAYVHGLKTKTDITLISPVAISQGVYGVTKFTEKVKNLEAYTTGLSWNTSKWLTMSEFSYITSENEIFKVVKSGYISLGYYLGEKLLLLGTLSNEFARVSSLSPSKTTTYDMALQYSLDLNTVIKLGASHVDHRLHSVTSTTGTVNGGNGISADPEGDFDVFDVQVAFVY